MTRHFPQMYTRNSLVAVFGLAGEHISMSTGVIVDAESQVTEHASMWQDYLEPEFKPRSMRIGLHATA